MTEYLCQLDNKNYLLGSFNQIDYLTLHTLFQIAIK